MSLASQPHRVRHAPSTADKDHFVPRTKTPAEVRAEFRRRGLTIRGWAKRRGVSEQLVHAVLSGLAKGHYGRSHEIAVALGIKDGVIADDL
jgi:gp16 family phage-associated protein